MSNLVFQNVFCQSGLCSWIHEVSEDVNWTHSKGLEVDQPWNGPQYDHTFGNNKGINQSVFLNQLGMRKKKH